MINFFRKIRQQLLTDNKISKYLIYAVGEIILVVIGILIALQINNWNETQKSKELSNKFHQRLADELDAVSIRLDSDAKRAAQVINYISKSVTILEKRKITEKGRDTLNFALHNFFQFVRIDGKIKTFQEMESTGQLGLIYNKELKDKTFEYLALLESVSKMYDQMANQVNDTKFVDQHVTLLLEPESTSHKLRYNFNDLAKDNYLINRLSRCGNLWQTKRYFSERLSNSSKKLKESYLAELNK